MINASRPNTPLWKSCLGVVFFSLLSSCCVVGVLSQRMPSTNSGSTSQTSKSVPSQSSLPCETQVKNYASALRSDVFPHVLEADAEAKRTRYADARIEISRARSAFKGISIPNCDGDVLEHASVYQKMLDEYWNAYVFADNDELNNANIAFGFASRHRDEASRIMGLKILNR